MVAKLASVSITFNCVDINHETTIIFIELVLIELMFFSVGILLRFLVWLLSLCVVTVSKVLW